VAKVGTSNQDRTISLKAAVCSCISKLSEIFVRFSLHIPIKVCNVRLQENPATGRLIDTCGQIDGRM